MKLPRDMGGEELAILLGAGHQVTRQTGSHNVAPSRFLLSFRLRTNTDQINFEC